MRSLSNTLSRLAAIRTAMEQPSGSAASDRLADMDAFGSNPGALRARIYLPETLVAKPPLVVVLHGCTQTAAGYDHGAGWSQLADRHGFALLLPEQQRSNNPNLCFNWFSTEDTRRGHGEVHSIRQMVAAMVERYAIDTARIFVTGLSAGGAMTSAMLAAYPEIFASGAIIAGLPYGVAGSVPEAFDRMRGYGGPGEAELAALVRRASDHDGPWPTVSVWHGTGDGTVSHSNASAVVAQWRGVHGVGPEPSLTDTIDGYPHKIWSDSRGRPVIEEYSITGMAHGTPLETGGEDGYGNRGAHMLETGISSTRHIAAFWGLTDAAPARKAAPKAKARSVTKPKAKAAAQPAAAQPVPALGVAKVIEDALRAAGLMR